MNKQIADWRITGFLGFVLIATIIPFVISTGFSAYGWLTMGVFPLLLILQTFGPLIAGATGIALIAKLNAIHSIAASGKTLVKSKQKLPSLLLFILSAIMFGLEVINWMEMRFGAGINGMQRDLVVTDYLRLLSLFFVPAIILVLGNLWQTISVISSLQSSHWDTK